MHAFRGLSKKGKQSGFSTSESKDARRLLGCECVIDQPMMTHPADVHLAVLPGWRGVQLWQHDVRGRIGFCRSPGSGGGASHRSAGCGR